MLDCNSKFCLLNTMFMFMDNQFFLQGKTYMSENVMITTYIRKKSLSKTDATISHCSMYLAFSLFSIMLFLMPLLILTSNSFVSSSSPS